MMQFLATKEVNDLSWHESKFVVLQSLLTQDDYEQRNDSSNLVILVISCKQIGLLGFVLKVND